MSLTSCGRKVFAARFLLDIPLLALGHFEDVISITPAT
jgi:hypothetical protein